MTPTLFAGQHVRQSPPETLRPLTEAEAVEWVRGVALEAATQRIRRVAALDKRAFDTAKLSLPYLTGAAFEEGIRQTERFVAIHYLVLDFDDCLHSPAQSKQLQERIARQESVWLMFVSPSGRGLKVWFRLQEPCTDAALYKAVYQAFASDFADGISLIGSIDTRTCDVTRVCFVVHDPAAYHNPSAVPLDWPKWAAQQPNDVPAPKPKDQTTRPPLDAVAYEHIRQTLNPRAVAKAKPPALVPALLQALQEQLVALLTQQGLVVEQVIPLPYGLKFCCVQHLRRAEVSVFYGKRGFSIVKTPKTGTDVPLTDVVYTLLLNYIFQIPTNELPPF